MSALRKWATPLTVGSFMIMGVTGTLMFFHLDSGLNKLVHEWAGWAMLIGVGAHLVLNWRAFAGYFKRPVPLTVMLVSAAVLGASFVSTGAETRVNPLILVTGAVVRAPLSDVAALTGQSVDEILAQLQEMELAADANMAIADIAQGDRAVQAQILNTVFTP
ncbi:DUF4405 domain-containing protein [Nioella aestuarii]|uniref:DUF4405 domain-containing protein n=1 Tax=Nioella aestuarii TaxID=1662864 RepID=UPI003D7FF6D7